MEENNAYLKFLITEDIYPIDDAQTPEITESVVSIKEPEIEENIETSRQVEEPTEEQYIAAPSKKLLVLYDYAPNAKLSVPLKKLMLKIIEAVKIDIREADYVNLSHQPQPENLLDFHNIICFGKGHSMKIPEINSALKYQIQQYQQTRVLVSASLQELDSQVTEKKFLWGVLQKMF